ncbi:hypothetical protein CBS101457_001366 [Exobasidium rhododendri]|nr:hypothetical protein CBS101457_001366 [Exobasidium rhododendri]
MGIAAEAVNDVGDVYDDDDDDDDDGDSARDDSTGRHAHPPHHGQDHDHNHKERDQSGMDPSLDVGEGHHHLGRHHRDYDYYSTGASSRSFEHRY